MENERRILYPTNDFIFKRIYGRKGSEELTESLLKSFTNLDVKLEEFQEQKVLETELENEKAGILDIYATAKDGSQLTIEMQVGNYSFIESRLLLYNARSLASSVKKGTEYGEVKRTITVMIVRDDVPRFKELEKYCLKWNLREEKYHDLILTDKTEIYIIRLNKIKEKIELGQIKDMEKISLWTKFLLNPDTLKEDEMENNEEVKKAKDLYESTLMDDEEYRQALRRDIWLMDMNSIRKEGLDEGIEKGIKQGKEEGIKEGIKKDKEEVVRRMKENKYPIEEIQKITGLTKEEIEKIK